MEAFQLQPGFEPQAGSVALAPLRLVTGLGSETDLPLIWREPTAYERIVKPAFDRLVALVLLLVFSPLMLAVALAVRLNLGSGVLFRQRRIGYGGREFTVLKFRTMRFDRRAELARWIGPDRRVCHKRDDDPRHTKVGRVLRKLSLDELPQLVNVLRGEMSLVGPRPELPTVVARYAPWQHARHLVRPGMTGLWQVTERASGALMCESTEPDIEYVRRISLATDVSILARTVPALLKRPSGS
jgi:lipopolysaccharide/colanic/teichoic acid biosynthesis glycosyltransferase